MKAIRVIKSILIAIAILSAIVADAFPMPATFAILISLAGVFALKRVQDNKTVR